MNKSELEYQAERASELLKGKVVSHVIRHRKSEVLIVFTDGTRLFVDRVENGLDLSITGGNNDKL